MALGIVQGTRPETDAIGDAHAMAFKHVTVVLDSSYPQGGYPASATAFGFTSRVIDVITTAVGQRRYSYVTAFDPIAQSLRIMSTGLGSTASWSEVTATASLVGVRIACIVVGY